jgi:xanthine dehydrogenase YagS FAD-binding subunit
MQAFEYASPRNLSEAVRLLSVRWGESSILAGGTDLISAMKDGISTPKRLVNIKQISELGGIEFSPRNGLRLGAMVTLRGLLDHADVQQHYPGLIQAAEGVRSEQLRNMGTAGGELLQRPRCWYYRNGYGLLAMHDGKSLVPDGQNEYHAILGNSGPAYFVSPSGLAPILIALGATVTLHGPRGTRRIEVEKLFVTPTRVGQREHDIQPNEILTEIRVPYRAGVRTATYEVRQKEALDWPLAAAAVALRVEGGVIRDPRVVLGQVAPVPWASPEADRALSGKRPSEDVADAAGRAAVAKATPLSKNGYKVQLARIAVKRAVLSAVQQGG